MMRPSCFIRQVLFGDAEYTGYAGCFVRFVHFARVGLASGRCLLVRTVALLLLGLLVVSLPCLTGCGENPNQDRLELIRQRGYIRVGTEMALPPFAYMDESGQLQGFDIDLIKAISRALVGRDDNIEFVEVRTVNRAAALNARQVDFVVAVCTITEPRKKIYRFTKPYHVAYFRLLVRKDSPYQDVADLHGRKVGFLVPGVANMVLHETHPEFDLIGFNTVPAEFKALLGKQIEAFGTQEATIYGYVRRSDCQVRFLPNKVKEQPYGVALRKDPTTDALTDLLNQKIDAWQADGFLQGLRDKWLRMPDCHTAAT
ncbi:MAG: transporter substrate-binding domain-containing protein [Cyanobacteria bacterium HKST-UBA03]|nr:transporter substrate-binding domain-containing protein [Cyanobacteria bacterium HKST-UBA03]